MRRLCVFFAVAAVLLAAGPGRAWALRVAWNVDVHQNKVFVDDQGLVLPANDFHVLGLLESGDPQGNNPPQFVKQVNFYTPPANPPVTAFNAFGSVITPSPNPPNGRGLPWYDFSANWSGGNVPFCTWVHFGLEFDETCHNIGYYLQAAWTRDGVDPGLSPIYGFKVDDLSANQTFTLQNYSDVSTTLKEMGLLVLPAGTPFPLEDLNTAYFDANAYDWHSVTLPADGLAMAGNGSEFEVDIASVIGRRLGPGEILISRQGSTASEDMHWQYELHEAHPIPEPLTLAGLGLGIMGLVGYVRRRRG
jgi:hypothetical protein